MVNLPSRATRAFTLIELVIVVVILAILAAIGAFTYNQFVTDARSSTSISSVNTFAKSYQAALATGKTPAQAYMDANNDTPGVSATLHQRAPVVRTNLAPNPSVEINRNTYWDYGSTGSIVSRTTTRRVVGEHALSYEAATTSRAGVRIGNYPVTVGETYTASLYAGALNNVTSNNKVAIALEWFNAGGGHMVSKSSDMITLNSPVPTRMNVTATVPENAVTVQIQIRIFEQVVGDQYYFDGLLFEQTNTVGTYFDGDTSNGTEGKIEWVGPPHASHSTLTLPKETDLVTLRHQGQAMCYALPLNAGDTDAPQRYTNAGNPPAGSYKTGACIV